MDNVIGNKIKEAMNLRKMKQADIVKKAKINKGALSSYINGNYLPKQTNLNKIAKALDVNPSWLMGYKVPMDSDIIIDKQKLTITKDNYIILDRSLGKYKEGQIVKIKDVLEYGDKIQKKTNETKKEFLILANTFLEFQKELLKQQKITRKKYKEEYNKHLEMLSSSHIMSDDEIKKIRDKFYVE